MELLIKKTLFYFVKHKMFAGKLNNKLINWQGEEANEEKKSEATEVEANKDESKTETVTEQSKNVTPANEENTIETEKKPEAADESKPLMEEKKPEVVVKEDKEDATKATA